MVSKVLKFILILLNLLYLGDLLYAQDPVYSQFYASPLLLNPAFAGNTYNPFVSLQYRNQWPSLNAYVTYSASYDQSIKDLNIGTGLMLLSDDAGGGIYKTNQAAAFFSYDIAVNSNFHSKIGLEVGYIQTQLNWDKLIFLDQLDPRYGTLDASGKPNFSNEKRPDDLTKGILDFGAGVLAYSNKAYFGFSAKHITSPDVSLYSKNNNLFIGLPTRLTLHTGIQIDLDNSSRTTAFISPNIMYVKQGEFSQLNGGAYFGFDNIFAGAWYRYAGKNSDALIGLIGFQKDILKIGYSYDITLSGLSGNSGGSHEISLTLNFDNTDTAKRKRRMNDMQDCFKMFR